MADGDGAVAMRDPEALVKEIERTRENLARTIDALTERASPANAARRVAARAREQAARPEVRRVAGAAAAVLVMGAAAYLFRRLRK
jgi:ferric-dicitrate binding protein FerR (iron transport regulator)